MAKVVNESVGARRWLFVLALAAAGCGSGADNAGVSAGATLGPQAGGTLSPLAATTLNTFVNKSLEIDQLGSGTAPEDANLFVGDDPADMTHSIQKPTGGPADWIDWNNLGGDLANHQLLDLNDASGRDPNSFPRSNECVAPSHVLSKMDLTYIAAANNNTYAYFGVQRSNNNGDAGYYMLFTKVAPELRHGEAPCHSDENRLVYTISASSMGSTGDVLLAGHFHPNGTPLLRVFHAAHNATNVTAVDAVDFTSSLWTEDTNGVAAVAVNTTITASGLFGAAGVTAVSGSNVQPEIFAEAAVPITAFTGGSSCGVSYYGSVITRSSGSGGTSPDLKDLAGPALFNFGSVSATATLTGKCDLTADYAVTGVTGPDGQPVDVKNATCSWTFDGTTSTSTSCSGNIALPAGSHTGTVTVSVGGSSCSTTVTTASTKVAGPLSVTLSRKAAAPVCPGMTSDSVTYDAVVTGGSGATVNLTWTGVTCSGSSCTIDPSDSTFCDSETFHVTATDSSGFCPSDDSENETYTKVTTVTASDN